VNDNGSTDTPPARGLQQLFVRGVAWKLGSQATLQLLRLGIVVVLARLVAPTEYGLASMALVLTAFVIAFSDVGLGAALVQKTDVTEDDRSTAFWVSVAAGTLFTLIAFALAGPIASFYGHHQVRPLVQVLSLTFVISSLGATHRALLARRMSFRSLELRTVAGTVVGGAVGIAFAARGAGAWALIAQELALALTSTLALWVLSGWHPRFRFSRASLREMFGFSANTVGSRVLADIGGTADNILVGRFLGSAALGYYAIAYKAVLTPVGRIALPIQEVLFPALSRMQTEKERFAAAWLRATRLTTAIAAPALIGLAILTPEFIAVVLGKRWEPGATVLRILVVVGLVQALQATNWSALIARGRTDLQFRFAIIATGSTLAAFVLGLHWGIKGVAACYATVSVLLLVIYTLVTVRVVGVSTWRFVRNLLGVTAATACMAALVLVLQAVMIDHGVSPAVRLVTLSAAGAAGFALFCALFDRQLLREVRAVLSRRGASPPPPTVDKDSEESSYALEGGVTQQHA
jgi:O-antigen/teichoic acid export membrane protein